MKKFFNIFITLVVCASFAYAAKATKATIDEIKITSFFLSDTCLWYPSLYLAIFYYLDYLLYLNRFIFSRILFLCIFNTHINLMKFSESMID